MSKTQRYEGKAIVVYFDPNRCMHASKCVHDLPGVFRPESRRQWIFPDEADADELAAMIPTCPSGALTYARDGKRYAGKKPDKNTVTIMPDGPLYIHAEMTINGEVQPTYRAALCRCGATQRPPYCDGSHRRVAFKESRHTFEEVSAGDVATDGCLEIQSVADGPLLIKGGCELRNVRGHVVACREQLVLCRCGASANKPCCDGSHVGIGFKAK